MSGYPVSPETVPQQVLEEGRYVLRFARTADELQAILRLRYEIFNLELGEGLESSRATGLDIDEFDEVCHHLMVVEKDSGAVVGSYRLMTNIMADAHRGFYSAAEFDLAALPREVIDNSIELGRACVARQHRSTQVLFLLWKGLALYVVSNARRYLFGCNSLTSQDPAMGLALMRSLESGGHYHPHLRVPPRADYQCRLPAGEGERAEGGLAPGVTVKMPALFRTYLRHGARVCSPPALDRRFKTIDFLVLFDVETMDRQMFRDFFGSA